MRHIVINGFHNGWRQLFSKPFTLQIDIPVGAPTEIDTLKTAGTISLWRQYLLHGVCTIAMDDKRLSWLQLMNIIGSKVKTGLDDGTFGSQHHHFVIFIVESRTYPPGVTHGKQFTRTRQTTHHITAIIVFHGSLEYISDIDMIVYISGNVDAFQSS